MSTDNELKQMVQEKYGEIADQSKQQNLSSCCGATGCCTEDVYNIMSDKYDNLDGYVPDADLGLGCGLPTEHANMKVGDTVIDLGSGAGNDAFIARRIVGETGRVIGVDFTDKMIALSKKNATTLGYSNVEFRNGDIESMPVFSNTANVVISNCVLNLVPNKHKVFSEILRVLKPGGHFSISDIVLQGELPGRWKAVAELYAGCVSGAIQKDEYLSLINEAGFRNVIVQKEKPIVIPKEVLAKHLTEREIEAYESGNTMIMSVTVYGEKPSKDERNCCEPGSGCC